MAHLSANDGGCWFCQDTDKDVEGLHFSVEFDTYVHESCVLEAAAEGDKEAEIMVKEFDLRRE